MKMDMEQIKRAIADGNITAISIDTSVIDEQQRGLEHGLLKRLQQFRGSAIKVVLSEVVTSEVEEHLQKDAVEAKSAVKRALRLAKQSWCMPDTEETRIISSICGTDTPESISKRRLDNFIANVDAEVLKADDHVEVRELLDRYFGHSAPFADKEKKKHECPDAIALLTLESWANENDTIILVVTKDEDWKRYCEESPRLVAIDDLKTALGLFQDEAANYICAQLSSMLERGELPGIISAIEQSVKDQIDNIEFMVEADSYLYFEDQIDEVEVTQVNFYPVGGSNSLLAPIEYGEDGYLVASIPLKVEVRVDASFEFAAWDSMDREYIPLGFDSFSATQNIHVEILITLVGRLPERAEVDSIEVERSHATVDFGYIDPDWGGPDE